MSMRSTGVLMDTRAWVSKHAAPEEHGCPFKSGAAEPRQTQRLLLMTVLSAGSSSSGDCRDRTVTRRPRVKSGSGPPATAVIARRACVAGARGVAATGRSGPARRPAGP